MVMWLGRVFFERWLLDVVHVQCFFLLLLFQSQRMELVVAFCVYEGPHEKHPFAQVLVATQLQANGRLFVEQGTVFTIAWGRGQTTNANGTVVTTQECIVVEILT